jgi:hypothetical protein
MATLITGRRVSVRREARRALANAITRAAKYSDPAAREATLLRGIATATSWLDGTHPKLAH